MTVALFIAGAVLAGVALIQSKLTDIVAWGLLLVCIGLLYKALG